jgi:hypothetical protein
MLSLIYTIFASMFVGFATNSFYLAGAVFFSLNAIIFAIMDASDKIKTAKNTEVPLVSKTESSNAESTAK